MSWMILFKKQLFDLEVKGHGPTKVIMVCNTPPYGHAPTYQISLTYLERQKCYGPDKKILFKKQLFDLEVKVSRRSLRYATHRLMVMHPHTKYNWPIWKDKKVMVQTSFAEKKQKNKSDLNNMSPFIRRGDIIRLFCFSSVIYLNKSIILGKGTPW
jgi:hypothetical protein